MNTQSGLKNSLIGISLLLASGIVYFLYITYLDYLAKAPSPTGHLAPLTQLIFLGGMLLLLLVLLILIPRAFKDKQTGGNINELHMLLKKGTAAAEESGEYSDQEIRAVESLNLTTPYGIHSAYTFLDDLIESARKDKMRAVESTEAQSLFLANMSHEIRTPLNGIIGFTELLKATDATEEQQDFFNIIDKSSQNLLGIINNILDLSKIESNKVEIEDVSFETHQEFEAAIETFAASASEKNIDLNYNIDLRISPKLKGDPTKLKEVLINLLNNAIKFTNPGGQVTLDIQKLDEKHGQALIQFRVSDTGIGMSQKQLTKIFKPFTQADVDTTRKYGGAGLGLTISKQYVELMGGTIDIESEKGKGSTFTFTLSIKEVPVSGGGLQNKFSDVVIGQGISSPTTILDNTLNNYLNFFGTKTETFHTIPQLKGLLKIYPNALILLDTAHASEETLRALNHIDHKQLLLISDHSRRKMTESHNVSPESILLRPLTPSKLVRALQAKINLEEIIEETTVDVAKAVFNAKALIAEDNAINQRLIQSILESMGLQTDLVGNGQEAFEKRKSGSYDIVFMDIQMPIMDGVEATHAILKYEKGNDLTHVPIVALTANALKGDRERFLSEGLDEYISKPIEMNELLYVLNKFLSDKSQIGQPSRASTLHTSPSLSSAPEQTTDAPHVSPLSAAGMPARDLVNPEEDGRQETTASHGGDPMILIAKRFTLSRKIIARLLDNMQRDVVTVSTPEAFNQALGTHPFQAIFTDEEFISSENHETLRAQQIPIILSDSPRNKALFEGLNCKQIDSVLSQDAIASILKTME
jgi:signal transduction histidine kinase/CheY-like chemotaxis protein